MTSVEIVFFDAHKTLLRPEPSVAEVYANVGRKYGFDVAPRDLEPSFRSAFAGKKRHSIPREREWWRQVVMDTFAPFGTSSDPDALFDDLCDHFAHPVSWRLYPAAIETITALHDRGYRTGLISNWDNHLTGLLEGLGLAGLLNPRIISGEIGVEKPDPAIFNAALDRANAEPEQALMIGDNSLADVEGARAVGMHAVLIDHHVKAAPDGDVLTGLAQILDLLPGRCP